jgi:hypothetical protein
MARKDFFLVSAMPIADMKLDTGNARIRIGRDQNECMSKILRKEDQMMVLMESIASEGLTTMPIIVKPIDGVYVVMDGNRRITALKLLNHPDSCPIEHLKARIWSFKKKYQENIPSTVDVLASSNDQAIAHEVLARHRGAAGGAGQLDWSAYLRTVYLLNHGHSAEYKWPGQYAMWAEVQGIVVDDEFPITTLQRFFTKENLALLGFKISRDKFQPSISIENVRTMTEIVMRDFGINKKNVSSVFEPAQAREYIDSVRIAAGVADPAGASDTPSGVAASGGNNGASSPTATAGKDADAAPNSVGSPRGIPEGKEAAGPPDEAGASGGRAANSPKAHPTDRSKLFGSKSPNLPIPEEEIKAAALVVELRRLDLKGSRGTPLAAAFLLRGLIEISDRRYRKAHNIREKDNLARNVRSSADHMLTAGRLDTSQHDIVQRYTGGSNTLMQIENLQKMLHRESHVADHTRLNTFWDELGCLIRACWSK